MLSIHPNGRLFLLSRMGDTRKCIWFGLLWLGGNKGLNMPSAGYHRRQAEIYASLALLAHEPELTERFNLRAMEHLTRAVEEPTESGSETARAASPR